LLDSLLQEIFSKKMNFAVNYLKQLDEREKENDKKEERKSVKTVEDRCDMLTCLILQIIVSLCCKISKYYWKIRSVLSDYL